MGFPVLVLSEIFAFVVGLTSRIGGRLALPGKLILEGKRARRVGLLLMVPLPLSFLTGLLIGGLTSSGSLPPAVFSYTGWVEAGIVLVCIAGALIYAYRTRRSPEPSAAPPTQH
jgi:hypothetical protein